jgi:hypothetical protein
MSWLVSAKQYIPAVIGEPFGGGYFAGYISHTANGVPTHALIVASRVPSGGKAGASGSDYNTGFTTNYAWATGSAATNSMTTGIAAGQVLDDYNARRQFDGAVNVAVMKANSYGIASYPAAKYIDDLNASGGFGGQTDWYLPSRLELDIAYFNLKPSTAANNTNSGANIYAVPQRSSNFTSSYPTQTSVNIFKATGTEAFFDEVHWMSTEVNPSTGTLFAFNTGGQFNSSKTDASRVRAFRKIAL